MRRNPRPKAAIMHERMTDIYNQHYNKVYRLALRMTENSALAEDLTQDTFLHINNGLESFREDSQLSTWIHRVAVNTVLMHMRKKSVRVERISLEQACSGTDPEIPAYDFTMAVNVPAAPVALDEGLDLERAFASLPPGYRRSLILHDVIGMSHEEAAAVMGCVEGTVKSQVHKGRERLRRLLRGDIPFKPKA